MSQPRCPHCHLELHTNGLWYFGLPAFRRWYCPACNYSEAEYTLQSYKGIPVNEYVGWKGPDPFAIEEVYENPRHPLTSW
ncbi:MAG: hypothetical protein ACE5JP_00025 [Candidatus Bipolaricaulia bacterium]